jgi:hypothetical protein
MPTTDSQAALYTTPFALSSKTSAARRAPL